MLPPVSDEDVERWQALEAIGRQAMRDADYARAEQAYRGQLRIFGVNPEPHVMLALIGALRDDEDVALRHVREAIVRGFTDLLRLERTEAWTSMRKNKGYRKLAARLPELMGIEAEWSSWSGASDLGTRTLRAPTPATVHGQNDSWANYRNAPPPQGRAAANVATIVAERDRTREQIERRGPVLGDRIVRLWSGLTDRMATYALENYLHQKAEAPDLSEAIELLLAHYSDSALQRWTVLSAPAAERLESAVSLTLERLPDGPHRPRALVARALALNAKRDRRNVLADESKREMIAALEEVVERFPDSDVATTARIGLIHTDLFDEQRDRARARFERYAGDAATDRELRRRLGRLALELGGLPAFEAETVDGSTFDAASLAGKVTVLDFWATWCPPCIEEFPTLRKIDAKHGDAVEVVGINMDYGDDLSPEELAAWIAAQKLPGSHLHDGKSWESELVERFGVVEIPFNVVVGADGEVLAINQHGKRLEKAVASAVKRR